MIAPLLIGSTREAGRAFLSANTSRRSLQTPQLVMCSVTSR
jgi:hypothetical protein